MLQLRILAAVLLVVVCVNAQQTGSGPSKCYTDMGRPQRCTPPFVNAAFNLPVEATNTCGVREATEYCLQVGNGPGGKSRRAGRSCEYCDARDPYRQHGPNYLTDFSHTAGDNLTWWQSETMYEGIQYPNMVNLTLHLGKSFDITYVRLRFRSSRPESFAIYKRTREDGPWIPYQFYSASCMATYGMPEGEIITSEDESKAICTREYSDISPLTGGSVAFSTLVGRPGAFQFQNHPVLQEFVTATDIRISLNRINTFGDEVFQDPSVLKSYFYAISDFAVGGICKCNGHASSCVRSTGQGLDTILVCQCEHNTAGASCEECLPFYNNLPYQRATPDDAHECQACNCNGLSNRCFFDEDLYRRTGSGGHCLDCLENTAGPNCERCKDNYYRYNDYERCTPCACNTVGSESLQCDNSGRCVCKEGVTGDKCDRCAENHFDFGPNGCRPCACLVDGSLDNNPMCLPNTGICSCKEYVEGQNCDTCKLGYYNLRLDDPYGCTACFCYQHASVCTAASGYYEHLITSDFEMDDGGWSGATLTDMSTDLQYNALIQNIALTANTREDVYFIAPDEFLGDQRFSYNRMLTFTLRVGEEGARPSREDIIIEGNGLRITAPIYTQGNPTPVTFDQDYQFLLHEHVDNQWMPQISAIDLYQLLNNVTAIKIRATYTPNGVGFLSSFSMATARQGQPPSLDSAATVVEQCECSEGYVGQFCESCMAGYHRDPPYGGPMSRCVPCNCNGHSEHCHTDSGQCRCEDHTAGANCERCEPGYYGYALAGTPGDCQPCPCPFDGECVELLDGEVACINCKEGYTGNRCELCADGYYGDPEGRYGPRQPCTRCLCNDNIDPNAVANCNTTSGECLKCVYNTWGSQCGDCLPGYYGDALALPKGQCQACSCSPEGSENLYPGEPISCDRSTGQCPCLPNVNNRQCERCIDGYWNLDSGIGCEACRCDRIGSYNSSCDEATGQCYCRPGVTGQLCDMCMTNHWGFDNQGCTDCECDEEGSRVLQCDTITGQCVCYDHIEGMHCDRCEENKHNITAGCIDCPPCYSLILEKVRQHREKLEALRELIETIGNNPQAINDTNFHVTLKQVNDSVNALLQEARDAIGSDSSLLDQLENIRESIQVLEEECENIVRQIDESSETLELVEVDVTAAEEALDEAERRLNEADEYMNTAGRDALNQAKEAQERFGQQSDRMTEIAQEAREEAIRLEEEASEIETCAETALSTSQEAYRIAQEALQAPRDTAEQLSHLNREVRETQRLYEQVYTQSQTAKAQAIEAYNVALGIYSEATELQLPDVDPAALSDESSRIVQEARDIIDSADTLMSQHLALMNQVEETTTNAEQLLEEARRQQQISDELLADANAAKGIAEAAVSKAEHTVREANETLHTLTEFNTTVHASKAEAENAMDLIPEIEQLIAEAESKTADATENLSDAGVFAERARDTAQDAKRIAEEASQEADNIRVNADTTRQEAADLDVESQRLYDEVQDTELDLSIYEETANEDQRLADQALDKAAQAIASAESSSAKVASALDTVDHILDQLASLDTIDMDRLNELESDLAEANRLFEEADLESRYNVLMESRRQQQIWVQDYTAELIQLRIDVDNIHQINATIPRVCYNTLELEPSPPTR